jgi:hypothetical protein
MFSNILATVSVMIRGSEPSSVVPAREYTPSSSSPLVVPKIEVIDLTEQAEYEYMYKHPH